MNNEILENPLVSIVILSYNRCEELRHTLSQVHLINYQPYEVIVVDNHSSDGTIEMIQKDYPSVRLIELESNIGIAGWNEGFKVGKGEYYFVLDDDSYPLPDTIKICVEHCKHKPYCAVIACNIIEPGTGRITTNNFPSTQCLNFIGCGVMIRSMVIKELGGFYPILFLYSHEIEFTMRVYQHGYYIDYISSAKVIHLHSQKNRTLIKTDIHDNRLHYYFVRNSIIIYILHFSFFKIVFKISRFLCGQILYGIAKGNINLITRAILSAGKVICTFDFRRNVLQKSIQILFIKNGSLPGFFVNSNYGIQRPRIMQ